MWVEFTVNVSFYIDPTTIVFDEDFIASFMVGNCDAIDTSAPIPQVYDVLS